MREGIIGVDHVSYGHKGTQDAEYWEGKTEKRPDIVFFCFVGRQTAGKAARNGQVLGSGRVLV